MAEILIGSIKKGEAEGVAELDASGRVPVSQLPSYVDDVLVLDGSLAHFGPTHEVLSAQTLASVWGVSSQAVNSEDGVRQYLFA